MTLLVIETITWKPHIETAMEIALRRRDAGERVVYHTMRDGLPVCEDHAAVHKVMDLPSIRVRRAHGLLAAQEGIEHHRTPHSRGDRLRARHEAAALLANVASTKELLDLEYGAFRDIGWGVLSSAVSMYRDSTVSYPRNRRILYALLTASIMMYKATRRLINAVAPDAVLLFNGRFATTRAAMRAAETGGVPWLIHERGCDKSHYWLGDARPHDTERAQQQMRSHWRPHLEAEGHRFFQERRQRVERRWHSFTKHQETGRLPPVMRGPGGWVTFFTSSDDEMVAIGEGFANAAFPTQFDAVGAVVEAVQSIPELRLCVRVHPHVARKSRADRRRWSMLQVPGGVLVGPDENVDSYALLDRSRVVCTYGSTMGIEATYWGRPSLLLSRSSYDGFDVCRQASDAEEIRAYLDQPTVYPRANTLVYGAYQQTYGEPYRYYGAESLHRGTILGTYLDDSPLMQLVHRLRALP